MDIKLPNAYTDDEWNDLTDGQRQQSDALYRRMVQGDPEDIQKEITRLEDQIEHYGPITSSDDYHDVGELQAELDALIDLLDDMQHAKP